jgi:saccharopine dehydrogenase-like NADP-dependent oxidoreductase
MQSAKVRRYEADLILGAGLVARPAARYLLEKGGVRVILADQAVEKADAIIDGHANGRAVHLDVEDTESLGRHVSAADIAVSLLPWTLHPASPRFALPTGTHLVTASYVKEEMQALDARRPGKKA